MFVVRPVARATTRLVGAETEPPFDIASLFENGEQGLWLDPNDLSTMFQDAAGTVPVTAVGQPVGLILDKSGRGNHALQATSASRPILRKNQQTQANYLEFDGVDDSLAISVQISAHSLIFGAKVHRLRTSKAYEYVVSNAASTDAGRFSIRLTSLPDDALKVGGVSVDYALPTYASNVLQNVATSDIDSIVASISNSESSLYVANTITTRSAVTNSTLLINPLVIGKASNSSNSWAANMHLYELVLVFNPKNLNKTLELKEYLERKIV